jgi:hypothetical protein
MYQTVWRIDGKQKGVRTQSDRKDGMSKFTAREHWFYNCGRVDGEINIGLRVGIDDHEEDAPVELCECIGVVHVGGQTYCGHCRGKLE